MIVSIVKKLDLSTVLSNIDQKNYRYYMDLSDDDKKLYQAFVLLRFISSVGDTTYGEYSLQIVNNLVNKDFWVLSKYPDLVHLLFCVCSIGKKQYHKWIPVNNKKTMKWPQLLGNQNLSRDELLILSKTLNSDIIYNKCMDNGLTKKEAKEYVKDFEKNRI